MRRDGDGWARDRGGAAVLVVVSAAAICATAMVAMAGFGGDLVDVARARTAADAAALAGVREGLLGASSVAAANGATLVTWQRDGADVVVTVRVGDAVASARATDAP